MNLSSSCLLPGVIAILINLAILLAVLILRSPDIRF
jgi:hypothetical protein